MAAQPSGLSTFQCIHHSQFGVISKLAEDTLYLFIRSLMNKFNKAVPSTYPWGTPLVTGVQLDSALLTTTL